MGTKADFYIKNGNQLQWLGSKSHDAYPDGIPENLLKAATAEQFAARTKRFLKRADDGILPQQGWPWPWSDSRTTDFSYVFEDGKVKASHCGHPLFDPAKAPLQNDQAWHVHEQKMDGFFPEMNRIKIFN